MRAWESPRGTLHLDPSPLYTHHRVCFCPIHVTLLLPLFGSGPATSHLAVCMSFFMHDFVSMPHTHSTMIDSVDISHLFTKEGTNKRCDVSASG